MKALIPNALTLARLLLAPVVAWFMWQGFHIPYHAEFHADIGQTTSDAVLAAQAEGATYKLWAAILFVVAALTDLFDGMAARALDAGSKFGRILDPIADKALVGLPLLTFVAMAHYAQGEFNYWVLIPVLIIVGRDVFITVLRLFAEDGEGVRVSNLAKIKTTLELIAVAMPIFMALEWIGFTPVLNWTWMLVLWGAAALSAFTALQYLLAPRASTQTDT